MKNISNASSNIPDSPVHLSPKTERSSAKSPRRKRSITLPYDVRILVVDDDVLTLRIAQRLLTKLGYDSALPVLRSSYFLRGCMC